MEKVKTRRRYRTGISSEDKKHVNEIIEASLVANGINPSDLTQLDTVAILTQALNHWYDTTSVAVQTTARESSLIHCQYPSSLMNQLIQHNDEVTLARPSKIWLFVRLPIKDVTTYGRLVQANTREIRYTNTNTLLIEELEFRAIEAEHIIRVTVEPDGKMIPKVYLVKDGRQIEVLVQRIYLNGQDIIGFKAQFEQVTIEEEEFTFSDDQLEKFIVTAENPIVDIDIYYRDSLGDAWRPIGKRLYFTRGLGEWLEYRILGNNKMSIEYKYVQGGFKPKQMGILKVVKKCTTGRNVKFAGTAVTKDITALSTQITYEPVGLEYFESKGGALANTDLEYVRNFIIKLKGARRRIDTESDLKTFLLNYYGDSKFEPRLVENNIKHRIFNIYTTLSFSVMSGSTKRTFTIPTNTGTLTIDKNQLASKEINGFLHYSLNSTYAIKSTQTRVLEYNVINSAVNTASDNPPEPVYLDAKDINESSFVYYYITPFIFSYDPNENFLRAFADSQYDTPYLSFSTYEDRNSDLPARFINTTLRVNDFLDADPITRKPGKYVFQINAQIRCEAINYLPILGETFQATLKFRDPDPVNPTNPYRYMQAQAIIPLEDDKYDIIFPIASDRKIFKDITKIGYKNQDGQDEECWIKTKTEFELEISIVDPDTIDPATSKPAVTKVNTYRSDVEVFKDLTKTLYLQTSVTVDGLLRFVSVPMVKMDFYRSPRNRKQIIEEINKVSDFIDTSIYEELDEYKTHPASLHDKLETLFSVSIKFTKTYGLSKFLEVGNETSTPIVNLQLRPTAYIRKIDSDFDESSIASQLNQTLITHDYFMQDFHMNSLVYDTLDRAGESVEILQMVNLDKYPPDHLKIVRNANTARNWDPPEVLSIEPVYNEKADTYFYNMKFTKI